RHGDEDHPGQRADAFYLHMDGEVHRARLEGDLLVWDDGDIWARGRAEEDFEGRWALQNVPGIVHVIKDGQIHGPDGYKIDFAVRGRDRLCIELQGAVHVAELLGEQLVWDDGDTWVREQ
ncbi:unnamed protein product, partial [Prorocentrum cordatum]